MSSATYVYLDFIDEVRPGVFTIEGYLGGAAIPFEAVEMTVSGKPIELKFIERIQNQEGLDLHRPIDHSTFTAALRFLPLTYQRNSWYEQIMKSSLSEQIGLRDYLGFQWRML